MLLACSLAFVSLGGTASAQGSPGRDDQQPIMLRTMGSIFFAGSVSKGADGETFHGDHGYAQYYIPQNSREYPLVMWHGIGQSGKTWESTPDGREGFMQLLPRRDWSVYIIDQPRRGRAGRTQNTNADPNAAPTTARESEAWNAFRLGIWTPPESSTFFPNLHFPKDPASIDQFLRQQTPDTGEEPFTDEHRVFMGSAMAELFRKTGPGILITHSNSGQYGWATGMKAPELIKAIVAYEPGAFSFPEGERPAEIPSENALTSKFMEPQMVSAEEFKKLTRMPILIIYGDNIAKSPSPLFNVEVWRVASQRAKQFADTVNRHGGDAQVVFLPDIGLHGNSHFPFTDLNNIEVADHLSAFLRDKGLDGYDHPHAGPWKK